MEFIVILRLHSYTSTRSSLFSLSRYLGKTPRIVEETGDYLVDVGADNEDGSLGGVHGDGTEPEVEARVFVAEAGVPQQQVDSAVGQEELKEREHTVRLTCHSVICVYGVCVRACVRACVCACVRACVRACVSVSERVCVHLRLHACMLQCLCMSPCHCGCVNKSHV